MKRPHSPCDAVDFTRAPGGSPHGSPSPKRARGETPDPPKAIREVLDAVIHSSILAEFFVTDSQFRRQIPIYHGNFDLYAMSLPFLAKIYLPDGTRVPQYEAVYNKIRTLQAKPDYTSRCYLAPPSDPLVTTPSSGRFESPTIKDPMTGLPLDVAIQSILSTQRGFPVNTRDRIYFPAISWMPKEPGIVAKTELAHYKAGIKSSSGTFLLKRVWADITTDQEVLELFEGFFTFNISFGLLYIKADFPYAANYKYSFWAVRARKDGNGRDIGLGPRV